MGHTNKIIDINGKSYDAVTGAVINRNQITHPAAPVAGQPKPLTNQRVSGSIDGFRRVRRESLPTALRPIPAADLAIALQPRSDAAPMHQAIVKHKAHAAAAHIAPHAPQKAVTLMRTAVKKPVIKSEVVIKSQTRTDLLAKIPAQTVAPKLSINAISPIRSKRAERMVKNPAISRYGDLSQPVRKSYNLAPAATQPRPLNLRPVTARPRPATALVAPASTPLPKLAGPSRVNARNPHADSDAIFEQALAAAISHDEVYKKPRTHLKARGKAAIYLSASLLILFLVSFFTIQNSPQLSLKVASYRSGLHAKLPTYQPSGYNFGYLDYKPGAVTVNYVSTADSQQYNISQKSSDWDSQALLNNFVASANSAYQTYQRAGRTIYVLSNNTATWVDSGIWYTVDGNASLKPTQLLDLASSM